MKLTEWVLKKINGAEIVSTQEIDVAAYTNALIDLAYRELAFWCCVTAAKRLVSKCEFRTFVKGEEMKGSEYYLWNIEPNKNQNQNAFMDKFLSNLFEENEALIVEVAGQLYVADSWNDNKDTWSIFEHQYTDVAIDNVTLRKTFKEGEVVHLQFNHKNILPVIQALCSSYGEVLGYSMSAYKRSRGEKGVLNISANASNAPNFQETYNKLINNRFKKFFGEDSAALPMFEGFEYVPIANKTYSSESTRDIKQQIDDIFDFTARGFGIPSSLIKGDLANPENVLDETLTMFLDPLADNIQTELIRKRYGEKAYSEGSYIKVDTSTVKHMDLFNMANSIDKLISSGPYSINEIRAKLGEEPITEDWADKHFITKNYSNIEDNFKNITGKEE